MANKKKTTPKKKTTKKNTAVKKDIRRVGYTKREYDDAARPLEELGFVVSEVGEGQVTVELAAKNNLNLFKDIASRGSMDSFVDELPPQALDCADLFGSNDLSTTSGGSSSSLLNQLMSDPSTSFDSIYNNPFSVLSDQYDIGRKMIRIAMHVTKVDHVAKQVVEMMSQFSNSRLELSGVKKKEIDFYKKWMRAVKFRKFLGKMFRGYYRHANPYAFRFSVPVLSKDLDLGKARAEINNFYNTTSAFDLLNLDAGVNGTADLAEKKKVWSRKKLPMMYVLINPLKIENDSPSIDGVGDSYYVIEQDFIDSVQNHIRNAKSRNKKKKFDPKEGGFNRYPVSFLRKINDLDSSVAHRIQLDESFAIYVPREKEDWEKYATPMIWTSIPPLYFKHMLRKMDLSLVHNVINKILKVTIGSSDHPATAKQMKYLARTLQSKPKNLMLLWNETLKVEYVEPDLSALSMEKYEPVNRDIKESIGLPDALFGVGGGKFSNTFIEVKTFVEKLATGREDMMDDLVITEFEKVAEAMDFDSIPDAEFQAVRLRDENKLFEQMIKLVDKGAMSIQTLSEKSGNNWEQETSRIKKETKKEKRVCSHQ